MRLFMVLVICSFLLIDYQAIAAISQNQPNETAQQLAQVNHDISLVVNEESLVFAKDVEFSSPSAAAAVIHGGQANGLIAWKNKAGKSLKELEQV